MVRQVGHGDLVQTHAGLDQDPHDDTFGAAFDHVAAVPRSVAAVVNLVTSDASGLLPT
jgi:hypothetical protein